MPTIKTFQPDFKKWIHSKNMTKRDSRCVWTDRMIFFCFPVFKHLLVNFIIKNWFSLNLKFSEKKILVVNKYSHVQNLCKMSVKIIVPKKKLNYQYNTKIKKKKNTKFTYKLLTSFDLLWKRQAKQIISY